MRPLYLWGKIISRRSTACLSRMYEGACVSESKCHVPQAIHEQFLNFSVLNSFGLMEETLDLEEKTLLHQAGLVPNVVSFIEWYI